MTRDEILNMEGPELGVLLIEHVVGDCCIGDGFGSTWAKYGIEDGMPVRFEVVRPGKVQSNEWRPGESISDAWEVVEMMRRSGTDGNGVVRVTSTDEPSLWCATVEADGNRYPAFATSAALAICRAALIACMGVE